MEASAAGALGSSSSPVSAFRTPLRSALRSDLAKLVPGIVSFASTVSRSSSRLHQSSSISFAKNRWWQPAHGSRRGLCVKASAGEIDSTEAPAFTAPLQLESPIGQFLSQILVSHPHLLPAAVEQQLQQLNTDRDAESTKEEPSSTGTELVLYRRIAEVKANDRKRALEEILYTLIIKKFLDAGVTLVPAISQSSDRSGRVDNWPTEEEKLENLHSTEAAEMIKNHLRLILGQRLGDSDAVAPISKLRVGQVYAASLMYGYFLKRVDQRFQLEKSMKALPWGSDYGETAIEQAMSYESGDSFPGQTATTSSHPEVPPETTFEGLGGGIKLSPLRSYVMSFDSETLQRYATIRSKEAFSIIEKHTEALFGRPEIVITPQGTIDSSKDELIKISFGGLKRLILEAVTFGSFLWEVESYVDSRYHFVAN